MLYFISEGLNIKEHNMRKLANVMQNYIRLCAIASRGKVGFLNAHVCYVTVNLLRSTTKTDKLECNFVALRKKNRFCLFLF